ncbi:hypothetical protein GLOIN_2v1485803 [Rhizophagus irregularis DAOM 181602=DAOM 197198]|uniref:Protein kinase domain-containing protein n=1 Tax=Rhizophagus irregularis (strain DAOM 181602 / DAOM 197198 / MUCL 43194) TaxID=747089 RepID=A0A2P4P9B3_RHIID|nr:hypothetical protein GLOIN_2v1485803 [Rhizophagus irregularis DAOM 181602=DAOM 197198]PKY22320.1 hypothetical protein RhiirB3_470823 [Rhizophagus irregularis]POG61978.1 hypothetical protein GLOIN_2v1485803 [Rhizophagus irregularis DAOM 181602=DAOM 197198]|eukprot:XP_025168844.1 hypothetical protein GLOIN_2v1485803 [Rhizophagus irregularis DAOM 181602=DAOM 197198]
MSVLFWNIYLIINHDIFRKRLHNKKVVHRDIRWDNVVKFTDGKWLLIDFEKAARIGDESGHLKEESLANKSSILLNNNCLDIGLTLRNKTKFLLRHCAKHQN